MIQLEQWEAGTECFRVHDSRYHADGDYYTAYFTVQATKAGRHVDAAAVLAAQQYAHDREEMREFRPWSRPDGVVVTVTTANGHGPYQVALTTEYVTPTFRGSLVGVDVPYAGYMIDGGER